VGCFSLNLKQIYQDFESTCAVTKESLGYCFWINQFFWNKNRR